VSIPEGEPDAPCFFCPHEWQEHYRRGPKRGQCKAIGQHRYVVVLRSNRSDLPVRDDGDPCACIGYVYLR
jgi:hypothetical protein